MLMKRNLTMIDLVDDEQGKLNRYHDWMCSVCEWAHHHNISIKSAMSILFEDNANLKNKVTAKEILSWVECDDFYSKYCEKQLIHDSDLTEAINLMNGIGL
jgi:hypothetical protein